MEHEDTAALSLTYEQFLAVLSQWDEYLHIEFSKMSRNFSSLIGSGDDLLLFGSYSYPGYANTTTLNLSDLAGLIWKTLEAGAAEVERIHDEVFVEDQVLHFKETYSSPERVASQMKDEWGDRYTLMPPTDMFFRLGKPAQRIITNQGFLEEAIEIYRRAEEIVHNKDQAEKIERSRERQQEKQVIATRRRVRELDKSQCVFCGTPVNNNFRYVQVIHDGYQPENVVFSCAPCNTKIKHNAPEAVGMKPRFGRFADLEINVT